MAERPILFSAPMVRALLGGTKTQTRRALSPQPPDTTHQVSVWHHPDPRPHFYAWTDNGEGGAELADGGWCKPCPYGQPGDRLWVREAWTFAGTLDPGVLVYRADYPACVPPHYENVPPASSLKWRPSIHLARDQSRLTLEVTGVRVDRLQDISEADAIAEGIVPTHDGYGLPDGSHFHAADPRQSYLSLWEAINGAGSVEANPWTWVVEFKRVEA